LGQRRALGEPRDDGEERDHGRGDEGGSELSGDQIGDDEDEARRDRLDHPADAAGGVGDREVGGGQRAQAAPGRALA